MRKVRNASATDESGGTSFSGSMERKRAYYEGLARGETIAEQWTEVPRTLDAIWIWHKPKLGMLAVYDLRRWCSANPENGSLLGDLKKWLSVIIRNHPTRAPPRRHDFCSCVSAAGELRNAPREVPE